MPGRTFVLNWWTALHNRKRCMRADDCRCEGTWGVLTRKESVAAKSDHSAVLLTRSPLFSVEEDGRYTCLSALPRQVTRADLSRTRIDLAYFYVSLFGRRKPHLWYGHTSSCICNSVQYCVGGMWQLCRGEIIVVVQLFDHNIISRPLSSFIAYRSP